MDVNLDEYIDLAEAAEISGLAVGTLRSYAARGVIETEARDRPLYRDDQKRNPVYGASFKKQHYISYGALLDHIRQREERGAHNALPPKPLPERFFEVYGPLAADLRPDAPPRPPRTTLERIEAWIAFQRARLDGQEIAAADEARIRAAWEASPPTSPEDAAQRLAAAERAHATTHDPRYGGYDTLEVWLGPDDRAERMRRRIKEFAEQYRLSISVHASDQRDYLTAAGNYRREPSRLLLMFTGPA